MQSEAARRAGDPSHQSEDPPPEGLGDHGPLAQTNPRRPAGQVMRHHLDRQPRLRDPLGLRASLPGVQGVAAVYRIAASMSPGTDGRRSCVEFHRRGHFDATIILHDGRSFGVVSQGLALRRRSLYDRLWAIAEYNYTHAALKPPLCCQPPLPTGALCATADTMTATATSTICPR